MKRLETLNDDTILSIWPTIDHHSRSCSPLPSRSFLLFPLLSLVDSRLDTASIYLVISSDRLVPLYHTRALCTERSTSGIRLNREWERVARASFSRKHTFSKSLFSQAEPSHESAVNSNPNRFLSSCDSLAAAGRRAVGNDSPTMMIPADASNNFKPNRTPETSGSGLFAYRPENPAPSAIRSHPLDIRWLRAVRSRARAHTYTRSRVTRVQPTLLALLADRLALWRNFFHRPHRYLHSRERSPHRRRRSRGRDKNRCLLIEPKHSALIIFVFQDELHPPVGKGAWRTYRIRCKSRSHSRKHIGESSRAL